MYLFRGYIDDFNRNSTVLEFTGDVHLKEANFGGSDLQSARLDYAPLEKAQFYLADLKGTVFGHAYLQGSNFTLAVVDGATIFWGRKSERRPQEKDKTIDRNTLFSGVALASVRIDAETKQLLEYNTRRKNWEKWYQEHRILRFPVRWFWSLSDYGLRTWRIILWFLGLALFFAVVYSNWVCWFPPGMVSNLEIEPFLPLWQYRFVLFFRPIYFSVVTMTTLGFGDMYANAQSIWGHILLTIQVILGYVLLGALITRFAVLFTAGGPAGKFADEEKEDDGK